MPGDPGGPVRFWDTRVPPPRPSAAGSGWRRRLQDEPAAALAVHLDDERRLEAYVAHETGVLDGGMRGQPLPVDEAVPLLGIDREVADVQRRQVLEEMRPLRRDDVQVLETGLDDDP